ncbi:hypothetical protein Ciccas_013817 [Cichlidogyrus casuarinus]|uniref:Uncharacterized protein n=1 Tax=Cichlidogyrus casuarinus TaxID=1844966 RepID=A0ABD2PJP3_9PLAT
MAQRKQELTKLRPSSTTPTQDSSACPTLQSNCGMGNGNCLRVLRSPTNHSHQLRRRLTQSMHVGSPEKMEALLALGAQMPDRTLTDETLSSSFSSLNSCAREIIPG